MTLFIQLRYLLLYINSFRLGKIIITCIIKNVPNYNRSSTIKSQSNLNSCMMGLLIGLRLVLEGNAQRLSSQSIIIVNLLL